VLAAPAPAANGYDRAGAIEGKLGEPLFNGVVHFKLIELHDASPEDHPETVVPLASQKVVVLTVQIRNGGPKSFAQPLAYTLADRDDVSFTIPDHFFTPGSLNVEPGRAARQTALFPIDRTFAPTTLIVRCGSCAKTFKPFRVTLPGP
jgi:hypothetical protein